MWLMRRRMKEAVLVSAIAMCYLVFLWSPSLKRLPTGQLLLAFQMLYNRHRQNDLHLEANENFERQLHLIVSEKLDDDSAGTFYFLNPDYQPRTWVMAPQYFRLNREALELQRQQWGAENGGQTSDKNDAKPSNDGAKEGNDGKKESKRAEKADSAGESKKPPANAHKVGPESPHKKIPPVQPFDPRFTIAVYLQWVLANPGKAVPFHWLDWVDLSELDKYILVPHANKSSCHDVFDLSGYEKEVGELPTRPVDEYCVDDRRMPLGFNITAFPGAQRQENVRLLGKMHVYSSFPPPRDIVFMTNNRGLLRVPVATRASDFTQSLLFNGLAHDIIDGQGNRKVDVLEAYKLMLKTRLADHNLALPPTALELEAAWFEVDHDAAIKELDGKKDLTVHELAYAKALKYSSAIGDPPKYFSEVRFLDSHYNRLLGDHHDWRFYNGLTWHTDQQVLVLHRLLKNYLNFCQSNGLVTWVAHGSLLSWYWNGLAFPWDADTDVQMPIRDLHRLARDFNQSLVVENVGHDLASQRVKETQFSGLSRYFVDVGLLITHRNNGNSKNAIDARFIDVDTGLYVDITGLSTSTDKAPDRYNIKFPDQKKSGDKYAQRLLETNRKNRLYNCRNHHFVSLDEVLPLVLTAAQNALAYVPHGFGPILEHEYDVKGMTSNRFDKSYYIASLRMWANTNLLLDYVQDRSRWVAMQRGVEGTQWPEDDDRHEGAEFEDRVTALAKLSADDHANLLYNNWLLREYLVSSESTLFHEKQMKSLLWNDLGTYTSGIQERVLLGLLNKAMWDDAFMYKIANTDWNYEEQVANVERLVGLYEDGQWTQPVAGQ